MDQVDAVVPRHPPVDLHRFSRCLCTDQGISYCTKGLCDRGDRTLLVLSSTVADTVLAVVRLG